MYGTTPPLPEILLKYTGTTVPSQQPINKVRSMNRCMAVILIAVAPNGVGSGVLVLAHETRCISWPTRLYKVPKETYTCVVVQPLPVSALNTVRRERKNSPYECSNIYITDEHKQFLDENEATIQMIDAKSYFETQRGKKRFRHAHLIISAQHIR